MSVIRLEPGFNAGSIRSLYLEFFSGNQLLSSGSGFVAETCSFDGDKLSRVGLLTAGHNFTGKNFFTDSQLGKAIPDKVAVYFPSISNDELCFFCVEYDLLNDDNEINYRCHESADVAVLALRKQDIQRIPQCVVLSVDDGHRRRLEVGGDVQIIGHPVIRFNPNYTAISSFGKFAYEPSMAFPFRVSEKDLRELPAYLVNARTFQGQSGSLVSRYVTAHPYFRGGEFMYDAGVDDCVLGLYSSRIVSPECIDLETRKKDGDIHWSVPSDLGLVWKTHVLRETLCLIPSIDACVS